MDNELIYHAGKFSPSHKPNGWIIIATIINFNAKNNDHFKYLYSVFISELSGNEVSPKLIDLPHKLYLYTNVSLSKYLFIPPVLNKHMH